MVSVQYDGIAGKKAITQLRPDLVITDIRMPGLNGLEMIELVRELLPECKVIFISFYEYFDYAYKAMKLRAQDFLIKPFEQAELLRVIQNVVSEIATRKDLHGRSAITGKRKPVAKSATNHHVYERPCR